MKHRTTYCILFALLFTFKVSAQEPTLKTTSPLIGLVDYKLVQIDRKTGALTPYSDTDIPDGLDVRILAYSPHDEVFYTLVNGSTEPELASITLEGKFTKIGRITLGGNNVPMCEGMSFDIKQDRLIACVSLNGNKTTRDYFSETIVEINQRNAKATKITTLPTNSTLQTDGDNICILGNNIYLHDGSPSWRSGFYTIDLENIKSNLSIDRQLLSRYIPMKDMAAYNEVIYFTANENALAIWVPQVNKIVIIGETHSKDEYNGKPIVGIDNILYQMAGLPIDDDSRR